MRIFLLMTSLCVGVSVTAEAADWPAFRGSLGNGISVDTKIPTSWGVDKNIKWKAKLPAPGNSSPIVSGGRVFVTCATDRGSRRSLYCFDRKTGDKLWVRAVAFAPGETTHKTNPYAGSTPVADAERVVVWHGSAGLYCYDFAGKELWSVKDLGKVRHTWGYGSSPVIHQGRVILHFGPGVDTYMTAVALKTGTVLWKMSEPGGADVRTSKGYVGSWSTPVIANVDGNDQILCSMPTRVVAYAPESGDVLWTCDGLPSPRGDLVYTSIVTADGIGVAMGGFRGPAISFKLGGTANVTASNRVWKHDDRQPQRIGSGVILGKFLYVANAGPGTVECIELDSGKQLWEKRLRGNHWGSMVYADGHLYVTNQRGTTNVFVPNPEKYEPVASNALDEPSNATPAISDGEIFLRTDGGVYCISD